MTAILLPKPFKLCQMVGELPSDEDIVLGNGVQFTNGWVWVFIESLNNYLTFDSIVLLSVFFQPAKVSIIWEDEIVYNFEAKNNDLNFFNHSYTFLVIDDSFSGSSGSKTIAQGYKFYRGGYVVLFMFKMPCCLIFNDPKDIEKYFSFPIQLLKISSTLFDLSLNNIYLWGRDYFYSLKNKRLVSP